MSGAGEGDTEEPVVIDKYTQTRQRLLKGKIVKSGHGRHYKKTFTVPRTKRSKNKGKNTKKKKKKKKSKKARERKKIKKKMKKQGELIR